MSWNNFQQPRWAAHDEPGIKKTVEAGGGTYISADANLSSEQQLTDINTMISKGAKVLIVLAQDNKAILPALKTAADAGIPVIAYDRLIEDPSVLYMTFDNVGVGQAEAAAILNKVPKGNYVLITGDPGDANASTFLPQGWDKAGLAAKVASGDITILNGPKGTSTDAWKTEKAQANMEAIIDKANADGKKIDAILAENDSTALGVVGALTAKSYGFPPLSGQDGDPANLNNVALGKQYVDVWKNANELGKAAGAAALQLCNGSKVADVKLPAGSVDPAVAPVAGLSRPAVHDAGRDVASRPSSCSRRRSWQPTSRRPSTAARSPRQTCARASTPRRRRPPASSGPRPLRLGTRPASPGSPGNAGRFASRPGGTP